MRKILLALLAALLLVCSCAVAEKAYLIADSNTRELTKDELWKYDLECVNFIYDEILARHGYVFKAGEKFDNWFRLFGWYTPNSNPDNQAACYPKVSNLEWRNIGTCKEVINEMQERHTTNPGGLSKEEVITGKKGVSPQAFDVLQGFEYVNIPRGQLLPVYWGPSESSMRGLDGRAAVSTNGEIYAAGWESGFLLIMYRVDQGDYNGSVHVGYIHNMDGAPNCQRLNFAYTKAKLTRNVQLTDDPAKTFVTIGNLKAGSEVTYLSTFYNRYAWDYVEADVNGTTVRGFIESGALDSDYVDMPAGVDSYITSSGASSGTTQGSRTIGTTVKLQTAPPKTSNGGENWNISLIQASDNAVPGPIVIEKIEDPETTLGFASQSCYRVVSPAGYIIRYTTKDEDGTVEQNAANFFIYVGNGQDRLILENGQQRYVYSIGLN
ncbi:MAG: YARHG domain-containing protein [Clostridia bacterium]|nr:YARHG domain-containing protein [Clostridia bacterium]